MAGYTRQSAASIINGENITAPPLNAEFNQLESSFNDTTGHAHDGTTGNGPKIDLTTSITGFLPAEHGGFGGKNNYVATTNPGVGDDTNDGYAVGSVWYNVPDDRYWVCVYAAAGAAVWLENRFVDTNGDIAPFATNTVDLGATLKRFKDLFLSGNADIDGSLNVATTAYVGGTLTVAGNTLINGDITLGNSATDDINVTARFKDDLVPGTDDTYDLGSSTLQWRNIWIDGTANIDTLDVHENATITGTLGVTGDATFANLDATGTTTITSVDLNSGAIDNATIGATTPAAATVTTLTSTGLATLASVDVNGGNVDNTVIGGTTPAAGTFTDLTSSGTSTHATVDINGGNIDATVIGASTAAAGSFTSLTTSGQATLATVDINGGNIDGAAIGSTTTSSGAFTTLSASGGITGTLTGNVTGNVTGDITGDVTGDLTGNVTAATGSSSFNNVTINGSLNMNAGTSATITNLTAPVNTLDAATKGYVDTSIANLVDSAPGTLDTLNELAAALGDDPNFSTTITNQIATKLSLNGGTMAGDIAMGSNSITGMADPAAAQDAATKNYTDTTFLALSGGTMTGAISMGANKVTSSATPSTGNDLTNKTYVDGILGSATAASASAAAAATSETNAATSETNAANSATAAASSATSAAASLDSFDDRYLGSKSSAPTVDNDGDALVYGALYFNTTTNLMYVYSSSGWVTAGSAVNGTTDRVSYTATAGQTVFSATYDAGYVDVYMNGVRLVDGSDFTATNGTSITLSAGAAVGDLIDIVGYGTFTLADHYTKTEADNRYVNQTHTGAITVSTTSAVTASLSRDGTDGDVLQIFNGAVGTTKGLGLGVTGTHGTINSQYGGIYMQPTGTTSAFFANGGDISFYDTSGNAKFFWDASIQSLGLGTDSPYADTDLHILNTSASTGLELSCGGAVSNAVRLFAYDRDTSTNNDLLMRSSNFIVQTDGANERFRIASDGRTIVHPLGGGSGTKLDVFGGGSGANGAIRIGDGTYSSGHVNYWDIGRDNTSTGDFTFFLGGTEKMRLRTGGALSIGASTSDPYNHASNEGIYLNPGSSSSMSANSPVLRLNRNGTGGNNRSNLEFYNNGTLRGYIGSFGAQDGIYLYANGNAGINITAGETAINEESLDHNFRIESNNNTNFFFVDAAEDRAAIGTSSVDDTAILKTQGAITSQGWGYSGEMRYYTFYDIGDSSSSETVYFLLAKKYTGGSYVAATGLQGELYLIRGTSSAWNDPTRILVNIKCAYNANAIRTWVGPYALHQVDYNGDTYYALQLTATGARRVHFQGNIIAQDNAWRPLRVSASNVSNVSVVRNANDHILENMRVNNEGQSAVFNEGSGDLDFRVESNNNSNMIFMDAGNDRVFLAGTADGNSALNPSVLCINPVASRNGIKVETNSSAGYVAYGGKGGNVSWYFGHMVNPSNVTVGSILCSNTSTSYNTSSDHRLKENVVELTGATERVKQLAPKRFNFIADEDTVVDGFIAHEAQTVVPEAVTGDHNEVDDDGNPVYQGIDQAKLVPLLTAALQEAITKIEDLEARVAALEA